MSICGYCGNDCFEEFEEYIDNECYDLAFEEFEGKNVCGTTVIITRYRDFFIYVAQNKNLYEIGAILHSLYDSNNYEDIEEIFIAHNPLSKYSRKLIDIVNYPTDLFKLMIENKFEKEDISKIILSFINEHYVPSLDDLSKVIGDKFEKSIYYILENLKDHVNCDGSTSYDFAELLETKEFDIEILKEFDIENVCRYTNYTELLYFWDTYSDSYKKLILSYSIEDINFLLVDEFYLYDDMDKIFKHIHNILSYENGEKLILQTVCVIIDIIFECEGDNNQAGDMFKILSDNGLNYDKLYNFESSYYPKNYLNNEKNKLNLSKDFFIFEELDEVEDPMDGVEHSLTIPVKETLCFFAGLFIGKKI